MEQYLAVAVTAARKAGAILQSYVGRLQHLTEKTPGNLVSEADTLAEAAVLEVITAAFPDHALWAEESGQKGHSEFTWAIDPLDGTTNYSHSYPFYVVSIGLLVSGIPTVGVVYDPTRDELFTAIKGQGAFLNGQPIRVSAAATLAKSLLVTGFAYDRRQVTDNNYREFCYLTHLTQGVRRDGAAALDLAYIAAGRFDGYWERGLSVWDMAAGVVLVESAGGQVTAYNGTPYDLTSGRILATNGQLHQPLMTALNTAQQLPPLTFS